MKAPVCRLERKGSGDRAVIVVHGIRQTGPQLAPFAVRLWQQDQTADVFIFDYDWTQAIEVSGRQLAMAISQLDHAAIDLVGYSMGGLVCRLAVADTLEALVRTIVTLATPNRGALRTSDLSVLGQEVSAAARFISPLLPKAAGLVDLTQIDHIMDKRHSAPNTAANVAGKRYASVPALYYHSQRMWRSASGGIASLGWTLDTLRIANLARPHDGIVSESSNNITLEQGWSELEHVSASAGQPCRIHAVHHEAQDLDHMSILNNDSIVEVVSMLLSEADWQSLTPQASLKISLR